MDLYSAHLKWIAAIEVNVKLKLSIISDYKHHAHYIVAQTRRLTIDANAQTCNGKVHCLFRYLFLFLYFVSGAAGFFVKHVQSGMCINDTSIKQGELESWGHVIFPELSNNCLDPAAQFRFRDNGAMLNLKRQRCLVPAYRASSGHWLNMFYIFVTPDGVNTSCPDMPVDHRAMTQTSWGGLSVYYKGSPGWGTVGTQFKTWYAVNATDQRLAHNFGIDPYIGLTRDCNDAEDKHFNFGKFFYIHRFVFKHFSTN